MLPGSTMRIKFCIGKNGREPHEALITEFHKDANSDDGYFTYCKACRAAIPEEIEHPQFVGDLLERCRALTQRELKRAEGNKFTKANPPKFDSIKNAVDILCKLKAISVGTLDANMADMPEKSLELLINSAQSELQRRKQSLVKSDEATSNEATSNEATSNE